jgi:hypothetical protein
MSLLGELTFFLGLQISQLDEGIFISQTKYIKEMLNKFGMENCKPISTLMVIGYNFSKNDESMEEYQRLYRLIIGILLYVTTSRLDVMQVVGHIAIFQEAPKVTHVLVVKRIFKYLKVKKIKLDFGIQKGMR